MGLLQELHLRGVNLSPPPSPQRMLPARVPGSLFLPTQHRPRVCSCSSGPRLFLHPPRNHYTTMVFIFITMKSLSISNKTLQDHSTRQFLSHDPPLRAWKALKYSQTGGGFPHLHILSLREHPRFWLSLSSLLSLEQRTWQGSHASRCPDGVRRLWPGRHTPLHALTGVCPGNRSPWPLAPPAHPPKSHQHCSSQGALPPLILSCLHP